VEEIVLETPPTTAQPLPLLPPILTSKVSPLLQPLVTDIPAASTPLTPPARVSSQQGSRSHTTLIPASAKQKGVQFQPNSIN